MTTDTKKPVPYHFPAINALVHWLLSAGIWSARALRACSPSVDDGPAVQVAADLNDTALSLTALTGSALPDYDGQDLMVAAEWAMRLARDDRRLRIIASVRRSQSGARPADRPTAGRVAARAAVAAVRTGELELAVESARRAVRRDTRWWFLLAAIETEVERLKVNAIRIRFVGAIAEGSLVIPRDFDSLVESLASAGFEVLRTEPGERVALIAVPDAAALADWRATADGEFVRSMYPVRVRI